MKVIVSKILLTLVLLGALLSLVNSSDVKGGETEPMPSKDYHFIANIANGRSLDLYTPRGGKGPDELGGEFMAGEIVHLISLVEYNDYPLQQKVVAFDVRNPLNDSVVIRTAITNEEGLAEISFRTPVITSSRGTWTAISTVEIAGKLVYDTISFQVYLMPMPRSERFLETIEIFLK